MAGGKLTLAVDNAQSTRYSAKKRTYTKRRNTGKKRAQGRMSGVRWFKNIDSVPSDGNGRIFNTWRPHDVTQSVQDLGETFRKYASFWSMYRCLKIVVKLIPVGIGSESLQGQAGQPLFKRGDVVTWVNQDDSAQAPPAGINEIIGKGSARLRGARRTIKIWASRPKNYPIWGDVDGTFDVPVFTFVDPWNSSLVLYGDNFTPQTAPGTQIYYWAFAYYKFEFKGQKH